MEWVSKACFGLLVLEMGFERCLWETAEVMEIFASR